MRMVSQPPLPNKESAKPKTMSKTPRIPIFKYGFSKFSILLPLLDRTYEDSNWQYIENQRTKETWGIPNPQHGYLNSLHGVRYRTYESRNLDS